MNIDCINVYSSFFKSEMRLLCKELGFPHKGWELVDVIDLGECCAFVDEIEYENCEFCGHERIRYVHVIRHPEYNRCVHVGCDCAEQLTTDYVNPKERETFLRRKAARRKNFMKHEWNRNSNGNYTLKYKGKFLTAINRDYGWGFVFDEKWTWKYRGKSIPDLNTARLAAFELFDR